MTKRLRRIIAGLNTILLLVNLLTPFSLLPPKGVEAIGTAPRCSVMDDYGKCVVYETLNATDVCKNIDGVQTSLPAGKYRNVDGNCIDKVTATDTANTTNTNTGTANCGTGSSAIKHLGYICASGTTCVQCQNGMLQKEVKTGDVCKNAKGACSSPVVTTTTTTTTSSTGLNCGPGGEIKNNSFVCTSRYECIQCLNGHYGASQSGAACIGAKGLCSDGVSRPTRQVLINNEVRTTDCKVWCTGCGGFCGDANPTQTCATQSKNRCNEEGCWTYGTGGCSTYLVKTSNCVNDDGTACYAGYKNVRQEGGQLQVYTYFSGTKCPDGSDPKGGKCWINPTDKIETGKISIMNQQTQIALDAAAKINLVNIEADVNDLNRRVNSCFKVNIFTEDEQKSCAEGVISKSKKSDQAKAIVRQSLQEEDETRNLISDLLNKCLGSPNITMRSECELGVINGYDLPAEKISEAKKSLKEAWILDNVIDKCGGVGNEAAITRCASNYLGIQGLTETKQQELLKSFLDTEKLNQLYSVAVSGNTDSSGYAIDQLGCKPDYIMGQIIPCSDTELKQLALDKIRAEYPNYYQQAVDESNSNQLVEAINSGDVQTIKEACEKDAGYRGQLDWVERHVGSGCTNTVAYLEYLLDAGDGVVTEKIIEEYQNGAFGAYKYGEVVTEECNAVLTGSRWNAEKNVCVLRNKDTGAIVEASYPDSGIKPKDSLIGKICPINLRYDKYSKSCVPAFDAKKAAVGKCEYSSAANQGASSCAAGYKPVNTSLYACECVPAVNGLTSDKKLTNWIIEIPKRVELSMEASGQRWMDDQSKKCADLVNRVGLSGSMENWEIQSCNPANGEGCSGNLSSYQTNPCRDYALYQAIEDGDAFLPAAGGGQGDVLNEKRMVEIIRENIIAPGKFLGNTDGVNNNSSIDAALSLYGGTKTLDDVMLGDGTFNRGAFTAEELLLIDKLAKDIRSSLISNSGEGSTKSADSYAINRAVYASMGYEYPPMTVVVKKVESGGTYDSKTQSLTINVVDKVDFFADAVKKTGFLGLGYQRHEFDDERQATYMRKQIESGAVASFILQNTGWNPADPQASKFSELDPRTQELVLAASAAQNDYSQDYATKWWVRSATNIQTGGAFLVSMTAAIVAGTFTGGGLAIAAQAATDAIYDVTSALIINSLIDNPQDRLAETFAKKEAEAMANGDTDAAQYYRNLSLDAETIADQAAFKEVATMVVMDIGFNFAGGAVGNAITKVNVSKQLMPGLVEAFTKKGLAPEAAKEAAEATLKNVPLPSLMGRELNERAFSKSVMEQLKTNGFEDVARNFELTDAFKKFNDFPVKPGMALADDSGNVVKVSNNSKIIIRNEAGEQISDSIDGFAAKTSKKWFEPKYDGKVLPKASTIEVDGVILKYDSLHQASPLENLMAGFNPRKQVTGVDDVAVVPVTPTKAVEVPPAPVKNLSGGDVGVVTPETKVPAKVEARAPPQYKSDVEVMSAIKKNELKPGQRVSIVDANGNVISTKMVLKDGVLLDVNQLTGLAKGSNFPVVGDLISKGVDENGRFSIGNLFKYSIESKSSLKLVSNTAETSIDDFNLLGRDTKSGLPIFEKGGKQFTIAKADDKTFIVAELDVKIEMDNIMPFKIDMDKTAVVPNRPAWVQEQFVDSYVIDPKIQTDLSDAFKEGKIRVVKPESGDATVKVRIEYDEDMAPALKDEVDKININLEKARITAGYFDAKVYQVEDVKSSLEVWLKNANNLNDRGPGFGKTYIDHALSLYATDGGGIIIRNQPDINGVRKIVEDMKSKGQFADRIILSVDDSGGARKFIVENHPTNDDLFNTVVTDLDELKKLSADGHGIVIVSTTDSSAYMYAAGKKGYVGKGADPMAAWYKDILDSRPHLWDEAHKYADSNWVISAKEVDLNHLTVAERKQFFRGLSNKKLDEAVAGAANAKNVDIYREEWLRVHNTGSGTKGTLLDEFGMPVKKGLARDTYIELIDQQIRATSDRSAKSYLTALREQLSSAENNSQISELLTSGLKKSDNPEIQAAIDQLAVRTQTTESIWRSRNEMVIGQDFKVAKNEVTLAERTTATSKQPTSVIDKWVTQTEGQKMMLEAGLTSDKPIVISLFDTKFSLSQEQANFLEIFKGTAQTGTSARMAAYLGVDTTGGTAIKLIDPQKIGFGTNTDAALKKLFQGEDFKDRVAFVAMVDNGVEPGAQQKSLLINLKNEANHKTEFLGVVKGDSFEAYRVEWISDTDYRLIGLGDEGGIFTKQADWETQFWDPNFQKNGGGFKYASGVKPDNLTIITSKLEQFDPAIIPEAKRIGLLAENNAADDIAQGFDRWRGWPAVRDNPDDPVSYLLQKGYTQEQAEMIVKNANDLPLISVREVNGRVDLGNGKWMSQSELVGTWSDIDVMKENIAQVLSKETDLTDGVVVRVTVGDERIQFTYDPKTKTASHEVIGVGNVNKLMFNKNLDDAVKTIRIKGEIDRLALEEQRNVDQLFQSIRTQAENLPDGHPLKTQIEDLYNQTIDIRTRTNQLINSSFAKGSVTPEKAYYNAIKDSYDRLTQLRDKFILLGVDRGDVVKQLGLGETLMSEAEFSALFRSSRLPTSVIDSSQSLNGHLLGFANKYTTDQAVADATGRKVVASKYVGANEAYNNIPAFDPGSGSSSLARTAVNVVDNWITKLLRPALASDELANELSKGNLNPLRSLLLNHPNGSVVAAVSSILPWSAAGKQFRALTNLFEDAKVGKLPTYDSTDPDAFNPIDQRVYELGIDSSEQVIAISNVLTSINEAALITLKQAQQNATEETQGSANTQDNAEDVTTAVEERATTSEEEITSESDEATTTEENIAETNTTMDENIGEAAENKVDEKAIESQKEAEDLTVVKPIVARVVETIKNVPTVTVAQVTHIQQEGKAWKTVNTTATHELSKKLAERVRILGKYDAKDWSDINKREGMEEVVRKQLTDIANQEQFNTIAPENQLAMIREAMVNQATNQIIRDWSQKYPASRWRGVINTAVAGAVYTAMVNPVARIMDKKSERVAKIIDTAVFATTRGALLYLLPPVGVAVLAFDLVKIVAPRIPVSHRWLANAGLIDAGTSDWDQYILRGKVLGTASDAINLSNPYAASIQLRGNKFNIWVKAFGQAIRFQSELEQGVTTFLRELKLPGKIDSYKTRTDKNPITNDLRTNLTKIAADSSMEAKYPGLTSAERAALVEMTVQEQSLAGAFDIAMPVILRGYVGFIQFWPSVAKKVFSEVKAWWLSESSEETPGAIDEAKSVTEPTEMVEPSVMVEPVPPHKQFTREEIGFHDESLVIGSNIAIDGQIYTVESQLGEQSLSWVYEVVNSGGERMVIKLYRGGISELSEQAQNVFRDANWGQLNTMSIYNSASNIHGVLPQLKGAITNNGKVVGYAMEYVEGTSIGNVLKAQNGKLTIEQAAAIRTAVDEYYQAGNGLRHGDLIKRDSGTLSFHFDNLMLTNNPARPVVLLDPSPNNIGQVSRTAAQESELLNELLESISLKKSVELVVKEEVKPVESVVEKPDEVTPAVVSTQAKTVGGLTQRTDGVWSWVNASWKTGRMKWVISRVLSNFIPVIGTPISGALITWDIVKPIVQRFMSKQPVELAVEAPTPAVKEGIEEELKPVKVATQLEVEKAFRNKLKVKLDKAIPALVASLLATAGKVSPEQAALNQQEVEGYVTKAIESITNTNDLVDVTNDEAEAALYEAGYTRTRAKELNLSFDEQVTKIATTINDEVAKARQDEAVEAAKAAAEAQAVIKAEQKAAAEAVRIQAEADKKAREELAQKQRDEEQVAIEAQEAEKAARQFEALKQKNSLQNQLEAARARLQNAHEKWKQRNLGWKVNLSEPVSQKHTVIGDVHGDLDGLRVILRDTGLVDVRGNWIGGTQTLVFMGDVIDRGSQSVAVDVYIRNLQQQAANQGGNIVRLLGNHELMFIEGMSGNVFSFGDWIRNGGGTVLKELGISESGIIAMNNTKLKKLFNDLISDITNGNIVASYVAGGRIFVHAGVMPQLSKGQDIASLSDMFNKGLVESIKTNTFTNQIFNVSRSRGGDDEFGGIFWSDYGDDLLSDGNESALVPQIVGHTPETQSGAEVRVSPNQKIVNVDVGIYERYGSNRGYITLENNAIEGYSLEQLAVAADVTTLDDEVRRLEQEIYPFATSKNIPSTPDQSGNVSQQGPPVGVIALNNSSNLLATPGTIYKANIGGFTGNSRINIGRDAASTLTFTDNRISRNHAQIYFKTDSYDSQNQPVRSWVVKNVNTTNGLVVDGNVVRNNSAVRITNGTMITLSGDIQIQVLTVTGDSISFKVIDNIDETLVPNVDSNTVKEDVDSLVGPAAVATSQFNPQALKESVNHLVGIDSKQKVALGEVIDAWDKWGEELQSLWNTIQTAKSKGSLSIYLQAFDQAMRIAKALGYDVVGVKYDKQFRLADGTKGGFQDEDGQWNTVRMGKTSIFGKKKFVVAIKDDSGQVKIDNLFRGYEGDGWWADDLLENFAHDLGAAVAGGKVVAKDSAPSIDPYVLADWLGVNPGFVAQEIGTSLDDRARKPMVPTTWLFDALANGRVNWPVVTSVTGEVSSRNNPEQLDRDNSILLGGFSPLALTGIMGTTLSMPVVGQVVAGIVMIPVITKAVRWVMGKASERLPDSVFIGNMAKAAKNVDEWVWGWVSRIGRLGVFFSSANGRLEERSQIIRFGTGDMATRSDISSRTIKTTKLVEELKRKGLPAQTVYLPGTEIDGVGWGMIVMDQPDNPNDQIRVFRGLSEDGLTADSVVNQVAYAQRDMDDKGALVAVPQLKTLTFTLAQDPTFENLQALYIEGKKLLKSKQARDAYDQGMADIMRQVTVYGWSVRQTLINQHLQRLGGSSVGFHITPYVSTTLTLTDTLLYSNNGAVLVMDLPKEAFAGANPEGEVMVQTEILPHEIVAIIPLYDLQSSSKLEVLELAKEWLKTNKGKETLLIQSELDDWAVNAQINEDAWDKSHQAGDKKAAEAFQSMFNKMVGN